MTREGIIDLLNLHGYTYDITGDKIIVTHKEHISLEPMDTIPAYMEFKNSIDVYFHPIRWISDWGGNIKNIDSLRLFNNMINKGMLI